MDSFKEFVKEYAGAIIGAIIAIIILCTNLYRLIIGVLYGWKNRKNISWTAFSDKEADEYKKLFPSIKAWQEYNTAKLEETLNSMIIRANWQYSNLIWPWIYKRPLYKKLWFHCKIL